MGGNEPGVDDDRTHRELMDAQRAAGVAPDPADALTIALDHLDDSSCSLGRATCDLRDAVQEEREPLLPLAVRADALQAFVVLVAVLLEEQAEVQQGLAQDALGAEDEG